MNGMDAFLEAKGWLALLAPLLSALLVLALVAPARRFGMVDHPGGRKNHDHPTPLVGGLAIFLAFLIVNALAGAIPGDDPQRARDFLAGTPWHKHVPARLELEGERP